MVHAPPRWQYEARATPRRTRADRAVCSMCGEVTVSMPVWPHDHDGAIAKLRSMKRNASGL